MTMLHARTLLTLSLIFSTGSLLAGQAPAKPDPAVKDKLDELSKHAMDRKGARDGEVRKLINELDAAFRGGKLHKKDAADYVKALGKLLTSSKVKRKPQQYDIYRTAVYALGYTGKLGSKQLQSAFKSKKFKDKEWHPLRTTMLEHLGRTKDPKAIGFLLDVALKSPDDPLMAAAGGALKHFADEKLAVRKSICKDLIKKFAQIHDNANKNLDPGDLVRATWEARHRAVADPWNSALQKLTKQSIRGASKWNTFWNKNKGANWDKKKTPRRR